MDLKSVYKSEETSISMKGSVLQTARRSPIIYLDNNATTPLLPEARAAMEEFYFDNFANTSSSHAAGSRAKSSAEKARSEMAAFLNADAEEIIFTSGASESLNLAIFGFKGLSSENLSGKTIVTTAIEHHAVLNPFLELEKHGARVLFIKPRADGVVHPEDLESAVSGIEKIDLAAFMLVNNETGAIQPVEKLAAIVKEKGAAVLCDAVQGFGKIAIDVDVMGVDMLALSAHKFYGPKGTGLLYLRRGTRLSPRVLGGGHEFGFRAGTLNVASIAAMASAASAAISDISKRSSHCEILRDYLYNKFEIFKKENILIRYNSPKDSSVASTVNVSFRDTDAGSILEYLSARSIMVSAGSACNSSGGATMSHVIEAAGTPLEYGMGSIRISFGIYNEKRDIDVLTSALLEFFGKDQYGK
ncbi:MAG TPA: cysteine desulfurase family protein [Candidatus Wallbacteria bacterium]|nr:cysteine desulfurase family protein [Candidatus Wallbacteria bacterium]